MLLITRLLLVNKGYIQPETLISTHRTEHTVDFSLVTVEELQDFEIEFSFPITKTGQCITTCVEMFYYI